MARRRLKEDAEYGRSRAPGIWFRLAYYTAMFLIAGILVGVLYLDGFLG